MHFLLDVCPAFVCLQIHLSLISTFLFRCNIARSLDPPLSNFLGHLEKALPVIQTELLCFSACPAVRSLHKYEASGVSTARKLLPPTGYISARDTVSIATQDVLFFQWIISKNRKTTSGVSAASAPPPQPAKINKRQHLCFSRLRAEHPGRQSGSEWGEN